MMAALKATMLKQEAEAAKRAEFKAKCDKAKVDVLRPHTCGCEQFWLPKQHKDHPESYRCCSCSPPPNEILVEKRVSVGYNPPDYSICFTHTEPVCLSCASMMVELNRNGYQCGMCCKPIVNVDGSKFWEQNPAASFSTDIRKYTLKQIEAFKRSNKYPLVQTTNAGSLPVDSEGFIVAGVERYEVCSVPPEDEIMRACELLAKVDPASGRGASKSVFLSAVAKKLQRDPKEPSCTCGAMIIAAGRMRFKITQDGSGGKINVSRSWWNDTV